MPRIPDDLIERIKVEVSIVFLVERSGVALRKLGENLVGRCKHHEDDTASLVVTPSKNLFHCMGTCQKGGSVVDFVMWEKGLDFRAAALELIQEFLPEEWRVLEASPARPSQRALECPLDADVEDRELARQVIAYYHESLKQSPEAKRYLEKRGLAHAELIERFQLGYSNRTLGMRLTPKLRPRMQALGFFREKTGHEHLNGRLVVPILGEGGEVLGAYGRVLLTNLRAGTPDHLYLPGPHRGVFNAAAFKASSEIILCEALIDALTFWRWGFRNVTSAYGAEGFTDELFRAFVSFGIERCFIAFDRDEAGDVGAAKVAAKLMAAGVACYRVLFPKGLDVNACALKVQPADKSLGLFLRSAEWMGNGTRPHGPALAAAFERVARVRDGLTHESGNGLSSAAHDALESVPAAAACVSSEDEMEAAKGEEQVTAAEEEKRSHPEPSSTRPTDMQHGSADEAGLVSLTDDVARFAFEDRRYRVIGLSKCNSLGSLRVSVRAEREAGDLFLPPSPITGWFQDTFDLGLHRQRAHFEKEAARELGVKDEIVRWDLGKVLRKLEDVQEQRLLKLLKPTAEPYAMREDERQAALELGRSPDLLATLLEHYERCGVVGEVMNKLALYLAIVSRKLDRPLAVVIRSSSAAGKTALMDAVLAFVPPEEREKYSALTENSLFYFEGKDFKHKVLALVEEEGAQRASYALKLLQSEGEITIASTGKDPQTGKLVTKEYRVEGPVMIVLTSTAIEIDEELLNRCLVLTVDEGREQTRAIHRLQREAHTLEGLRAREERERILRLHQNLQRLLRPLFVHNPYAAGLTFLDEKTRARRDHTKYLALIDSIALLHQHQREIKTLTLASSATANGSLEVKTIEYIEAELSDIELANGIAAEVLGRSLDELPPQTTKLLMLLDEMVTAACEKNGAQRTEHHFSRRDVRLATGWGHSQLCIHLDRLVAYEYLLVHRGGRGQSFVYELVYQGEGKDGSRFVLGLMDIEKLVREGVLDTSASAESTATTTTFRGAEGELPGSFRPYSGAIPGRFRVHEIAPGAAEGAALRGSSAENKQAARIPASGETASYRSRRSSSMNAMPFRPRLRLNLLHHPPRQVDVRRRAAVGV